MGVQCTEDPALHTKACEEQLVVKVKMLLVRNYINKKKTFGGIIKHFISFISSKAVYVDRFTEN